MDSISFGYIITSIYDYFVSTPFVFISAIIKASLFSVFLINMLAALIIFIKLKDVLFLIDNTYSKIIGVFLCLYTQTWDMQSNGLLYVAYLCAFFLSCYVSEGCWHVAESFKKEGKSKQQKVVFFMTILLFCLLSAIFYMNKVSETMKGQNLFLIFFAQFIVVVITVVVKERSLLFTANVLTVAGFTVILRNWVSKFYKSFLSLSVVNFPFEAILFILLGIHGRNKEKEIEKNEVRQIKDRIFYGAIQLFVYCLMTKRYPAFENLLFFVSLYYLIRKN